jgi:DNA-binding NtrC family response regulator
MIQLDQTTVLHNPLKTQDADGEMFDFGSAQRQRKRGLLLQLPSGLVVSSDDEVRRKLAHVLRGCSMTPVLASSVAESGIALAGHEISVVVCNDRLDDGEYEDIVRLVVRSETKVPVIVVSRTGDWPEYLTAMSGGAFDYLAYPSIPGDLQQTIQNALLRRPRHLEENGEETWASNQ